MNENINNEKNNFDSLLYKYEYYEISEKYININFQEMYESKTIILQSGTGSGKTTCTAKQLHSYFLLNHHHTLLSIVNLITLAKQQIKTFQKQNIKLCSYQDTEVEEIMDNHSVICINSLHKLAQCDFTDKVIYIDEIYSLCNTLTHNDTIKNQRLVYNTLIRAIKECHKLIVSDAHIYDNVMMLLEQRLQLYNSPLIYVNTYNKFDGINCNFYDDENKFYKILESRVKRSVPFIFGSDNKTVITKYYQSLYDMADKETQSKMFLYTSETNEELCDDWNDKLIFYSPKITTAVDIKTVSKN